MNENIIQICIKFKNNNLTIYDLCTLITFIVKIIGKKKFIK